MLGSSNPFQTSSSLEKDIEQEDFNVVVLVDRLTTRAFGVPSTETVIDPGKLSNYFESSIAELKELKEKLLVKSANIEAKCQQEEVAFHLSINKLREEMQVVENQFSDLDERIHQVSRKVVHLGDQLEAENVPRERIAESKDLIRQFFNFKSGDNLKYPDDATQILEAAATMQKLSTLCLELPDDTKFSSAKTGIERAQDHLDDALLSKFSAAYRENNLEMMRKLAQALSYSKNYSKCVAKYVSETIVKLNMSGDLINQVYDLCEKSEKLILQVFSQPENVMIKLIQNIFTDPLRKHLNDRLANKDLEVLYTLYTRMERLCERLSHLTLCTDTAVLNKLFKDLFSARVQTYIQAETSWLSQSFISHLQRYYESVNHQKKQLSVGNMADLKREFQAKLHMGDVSMSNTVLISDETTINMLEDCKNAAKRCKSLSQHTDLPDNSMKLFNLLIHYLIDEHVEYGVELSLQAIPTSEPKSEISLCFFEIVYLSNTVFQFLEKIVNDSLIPLLSGSPKQQECLSKMNAVSRELESKISTGLEKLITAACNYVHFLLSSEQKKTDYNKPEGELTDLPTKSIACHKVEQFLLKFISRMQQHLDGQNLTICYLEFGLRFHRVIVDHFYQYTFSLTGGFVAMQDVTTYRDCMKKLDCPVVSHLFDTLLKLVNLMVMKAENVKQVFSDYNQSGIQKDILISFIQLRSDYKTAKILQSIKDD